MNTAPKPKPYIGSPLGGVISIVENAIQSRLFATLSNGYVPADTPDGRTTGTLKNMPIYGKIILGKEDGSNNWTDAQGNTGSYNTVELDCAICTIDFNSQVVKTNIQGLGYSIKEFISSGDNDITIEGRYDSTPSVAPMDFIINLGLLFSAPVPIPVTNYFLNANNIYYIVCVPGCQLPQEQGGYSYQKFTIKAISDVPNTTMLP